MDIEDGEEYADVLDASGARIRFWVERAPRALSWWRRALGMRPKIDVLERWERQPPTVESRRELAERLAHTYDGDQASPLAELVALAEARLSDHRR